MKTAETSRLMLRRLRRQASFALMIALNAAASFNLYSATARCDTQSPSESDQQRMQQRVMTWRESSQTLLATDIVVPVFFHVLRRNDGSGDIPDQQLFDQIDVLNSDYHETRFRFLFAGSDRTNNSMWAGVPHRSEWEIEMKRQLSRDVLHTLNVYVCPDLPIQLPGWGTFPFEFEESDFMHGVVVLKDTFPGGTDAPFNLGKTLTHEVGHYLGLLHTFQGSCSPVNDGADDTPAHQVNYGKPPDSTDTCPNSEGNDPVHNYMNYTDDDWMSQFTPGQAEVAYAEVSSLRPQLWASGQQNASTLSNISTRLYVGTGSQVAIAGFIVSGKGVRNVVVRGSGPLIGTYGLAPFLRNPTVTLYAGSTVVGSNDDWKIPQSNYDMIAPTGLAPAYDVESALWLPLSSGVAYTAKLEPNDGSSAGVGLLEVFDCNSGSQPNRIINISTRGYVGSGGNTMIAGFIVSGGYKQVLIRGVGPTLSSFGVVGAVSNPKIILVNTGTGQTIASNNNWGSSYAKSLIAAESQRMNLFPLTNDHEAALVCVLGPGSYTALVSPEDGAAGGVGLVEVYDVNGYE